MENKEAKNLVELIFSLIEKAKQPNQISQIIQSEEISDFRVMLEKNFVNINFFPQIDLEFSKSDIKDLEDYFKNSEFKINDSNKIKDPLSKLLYSLAWKNGDLGKIKHIFNGIRDGFENQTNNVKQAIVFHQFGKHLAKPNEQPIIDQHVIRAYAFYTSMGLVDDELNRIRKIEEITLNHNYFVNGYVKWIKGITDKLENKRDFIYQVDRLLFAVGKTIKLKKIKK